MIFIIPEYYLIKYYSSLKYFKGKQEKSWYFLSMLCLFIIFKAFVFLDR